jgi:hypothetical protein
MTCIAQQRNWRPVALTAMAVAALPLTSNLATLVFAPVLLTYGLLLLAQSRDRRALLWRLAACAALAVGLAAFFWLPAAWDRPAVQVERGYTPGGVNVFHNFLPLRRILSQPLVADISRVCPHYALLSLSPAITACALFAVILSWRRMDREWRWLAVWALVGAGVCVGLSTRASAPLYRAIPPLQMLQFPWRFLAPATLLVGLLVALAASAALRALSPARARVGLVLSLLGIVLLSWPSLYPGLYCAISPTPTLAETVPWEVGMVGSIGTYAEYLPDSVKEVPESSPMFGDYVHGNPVVRWDQARLPGGARTLDILDDGLYARWEVDTPEAFGALYQAFFFPGWQATVDGQPVPIQVADPHGLIEVPVPAGRHTVEVHFGSTPERIAATVVSLAALALTLYLVARPGRDAGPARSVQALAPGAWIAASAAGVVLLLLRIGLVDRLDWWPRTYLFDGQTVRGLAHPTDVAWTSGARLLGYELSTRPGSRGGDLDFELYWATDTGIAFRSLVRLVDEQGVAWSDWDKVVDFPGFIGPPATSMWGADRYTSFPYRIVVPPGTPPGTYYLSVAVIDPNTRQPAYVVRGEPLNAERTEAVVGQVEVKRQRVRRGQIGAYADDEPATFAEELLLLGCERTHSRATVGERVKLYPLWWSDAPPKGATLTLQLVNDQGEAIYSETFSLGTRIPADQWDGPELVRDRYDVLIPPDISPGQYAWRAQIEAYDTPVDLGTLEVYVPERRYEVPQDAVVVGQTLDGAVRLAGYRAGEVEPGQPLQVTLYWQSQEVTQTDYKVFVQLLSDQNAVVAQSDAIPAQWTRLVPGWLPPEVIEDPHTLWLPADMPAGTYRLVVGLYEPKTGRRALKAEGADVVPLWEGQIAGK